MSETKEESNSTSSDVKEEEDSSSKAEDIKMDDSSKDSEKESDKNDSTKDEKKESEKDDSEEEDEDESDEEGMGLLDRPVEVSGCRARKKVERLDVSFATSKDKGQPIPEGKGKKLGECPRIEFQILKTPNNDLKALHRVLFNRVGGANEIKKNIRKFSGFTFGKKSTEYERKKSQVEKLTGPILKHICGVLDIERGGLKDEIVKRVLEFLLEPKDSGKSAPVPKKKTSIKNKKKTTAKKGKKAKAKDEKDASEESDAAKDSASDKGSDNDEKDEESENDNDSKEVKKKNAKKPLPKTKKVEKKEKPKKEEKKTPAKGSKRKRDDNSDDKSEEPSTKKKMPSDDEIKKLVKRILDAADLQEITMKKVIKKVAEAYPDCDLSEKKPFIKSFIKSSIS